MPNQSVIEAPKCPECFQKNGKKVTMRPAANEVEPSHGKWECPTCGHELQR